MTFWSLWLWTKMSWVPVLLGFVYLPPSGALLNLALTVVTSWAHLSIFKKWTAGFFRSKRGDL